MKLPFIQKFLTYHQNLLLENAIYQKFEKLNLNILKKTKPLSDLLLIAIIYKNDIQLTKEELDFLIPKTNLQQKKNQEILKQAIQSQFPFDDEQWNYLIDHTHYMSEVSWELYESLKTFELDHLPNYAYYSSDSKFKLQFPPEKIIQIYNHLTEESQQKTFFYLATANIVDLRIEKIKFMIEKCQFIPSPKTLNQIKDYIGKKETNNLFESIQELLIIDCFQNIQSSLDKKNETPEGASFSNSKKSLKI